MLALAIWADRLLEAGCVEESRSARMIAAGRGSTEALTNISASYQTASLSDELSPGKRLESIITMMAYTEAAAMRGYTNGVLSALFKIEWKGAAHASDQLQPVTSSAVRIQATLEQGPSFLGLGSFENISDPFTEYQHYFMASVMPNPKSWPIEYLSPSPVKSAITGFPKKVSRR